MDKKSIFLIITCILIIIILIIAYKSQELKRNYNSEVKSAIKRTSALKKEILTIEDIKHLPEPVQKYLSYVGVIGKEKVYNVKVVAEGEMKLDPKKGWTKIQSEQYNFFDKHLSRLFYMKAVMLGVPVYGLHTYTDEKANMIIRAGGVITVLNAKGQEMRVGDTTTLLNDMCFFAPAALIDDRISWEAINSLTAKATFKTNEAKISALLYFNEKGELIDFVSEDRYYTPLDGSSRKARWSTPISNYKEKNGYKLPTYGEAIWKFPEGDYCYIKFTNIKEVKYNCN